MGQSLTVRTPNLEGRLGELDVALSNVAKGVASNLQTSLASLAPPEVVEGLVTPLAARLDSSLGGLLKGLNRTAESTLPALLERAAGTVVFVGSVSVCLTNWLACLLIRRVVHSLHMMQMLHCSTAAVIDNPMLQEWCS